MITCTVHMCRSIWVLFHLVIINFMCQPTHSTLLSHVFSLFGFLRPRSRFTCSNNSGCARSHEEDEDSETSESVTNPFEDSDASEWYVNINQCNPLHSLSLSLYLSLSLFLLISLLLSIQFPFFTVVSCIKTITLNERNWNWKLNELANLYGVWVQ